MASLREIRNKLRSVDNIKKIAQAMEMIAAARLRKAHTKLEQAQAYTSQLREMLDNVFAADPELSHPLMRRRPVSKVGLLIISSDKGLCGSYNNNLFSAAETFLAGYPAEQVELFVVGRKAADHYARRPWKIRSSITDWGGKITLPQVKRLADELVNAFTTGQLDEIWMTYTFYLNLMTRKVMVEKLLNVEKPHTASAPTADFLVEPSLPLILEAVLQRWCLSSIQMALHQAYATELAARVMSMRSATKNAEEMHEKLTLVRNKVRQAGITREMIEITSGAESFKNQ